MAENPISPDQTDGDFLLPTQLPVELEVLRSQPGHNFECDAQLAAWQKLRWEKKSPTFYMVNIDGRHHLAVFNRYGAWRWRRALVGSTNYTYSPGEYESKHAAQTAAINALYMLQSSEDQVLT